MTTPKILLWFRQDLRLRDNPALVAASRAGTVLPVYILDDENAGDRAMGSASRWWLHQSLAALDNSLDGKLWILKGDPLQLIPKLLQEQNIGSVHWNRCYEPWRVRRDKKLKQQLQNDDIDVSSHNGSLLFEPWESLKKDGTPYKVFTPFYRNAASKLTPIKGIERKPAGLDLAPCSQNQDKLDSLQLMPTINWYDSIAEQWTPGEEGAHRRLQNFLNSGLDDYRKGRDFPARESVSFLSPHLHHGEVSPRQVWHAAQRQADESGMTNHIEHFQSELGWREFSYSLLYHFPQLVRENMNTQFNDFPWRHSKNDLEAWQRGETGFPLVDAGMRQLYETGYMHNRVRMVVGSFLVKNLMHHWHAGERWFWDTLVDADLANNVSGWQWVAGCGADAAPYFRIFNPITQSEKFDPEGEYIRRFVPELSELPNKLIHDPTNAPPLELEAAGIKLGETYPKAIVDLKESRQRALDAYQKMRKGD